ncbi:MAG: hypothetical protein LBC72_01215, partial [Spirochaetaceae bacterium]|nr:hypothetical protein [Spirochaetaceae bacterium]
MAITACNQPIQRPQGGGTNPADDSIAALAYLGIETAFSAAPDIVPQMSAGTAAAPKSLSEATSPEKGYFVLYPDGPGGEVRILAQTKAGAFIRDASVNGTTIAAETDEPAANEDDGEDGEDEEPDGEDPAEPALLAYVFTVNGAGYTAFKLTVVDEASGESADYTVTLQPSSMSGTGTALDDLTGRLYDDPEGDITKLYAGLATHTTQLDTLILALDELEVNAQIAMLTEKTLEGGGPWQADITGAAFIYIQFNDGGRFHPVPKDSLGAASILLADGGGTASFTVNSDTLTITVAGSGEPAALYAGTNSADCQSLVLLKQQFDLLDTALEATYLTQASFNSALTSYYTKTQIEGNYTATADLAAWVQTNALGSYSTTAAMDTAIADAISDALADFDDGDAVDVKIEAVRDALAESIGDLDTALTSLTSKVTALEAGTAAFVLDSA